MGKSTFIRCAFDLGRSSLPTIPSKKMTMEGNIFQISLLEISICDVGTLADHIQWPETHGDQKVPPIHAVLVLYDVMDSGSIKRIPQILRKFPNIRNSPVYRRQFRIYAQSWP